MNTLCRLCFVFLVYCAASFHGQHTTSWQWSLINPFSSHCSSAITQVSFGGHTCECLLLWIVTSIMCWCCVDACVDAQLWLSRETRRLSLNVWTSVDNSRCRAVTWGGGEDLTTLEIPPDSCPNNFVSKYWGVTWVMSPYIPFSCKTFIPLLPLLFVFATFFFLQKTSSWFLDSLAVYSSGLCPINPMSSRTECQSVSGTKEMSITLSSKVVCYEDILLTPLKQLGVGVKTEEKYLLPISHEGHIMHSVPSWTLRRHKD